MTLSTGPGAGKIVTDFEIGGYVVPRKSLVLMSQFVMHRDPRFTEPLNFDPNVDWRRVSFDHSFPIFRLRWTAPVHWRRLRLDGGSAANRRTGTAVADETGAESSRGTQAGDHLETEAWHADDVNQEADSRGRRQRDELFAIDWGLIFHFSFFIDDLISEFAWLVSCPQ